jgi:hypothetical protein
LLEEEAREKGQWNGQDQQTNANGNGNGSFAHMPTQNFNGMMSTQPGYDTFPQAGSMQAPQQFLPAALLAQYPALAGLQWDQLPAGPPDDEGDISGRSSFDASSGGEYFDDEGDYQGQQQQPVYAGGIGNGWVSDSYDGR